MRVILAIINGGVRMITNSLREWLQHLEKEEKIKSVTREVDLNFELSAIAKKLDGIAAVKFKNPRNCKIPVVSNIVYNRQIFAEAMGHKC